MTIFAIGDPHLSFAADKPMDIFGSQWQSHPQHMAENWLKTVGDDDWVLMPGDISWAMTLEQAEEDLSFLHGLPGKKVLIRGNHDYWWSTLSKVRSFLPNSLFAIQNDSLVLNNQTIICGTRGWNLPGMRDFTAEDQKIYAREVNRLKLSLEHAKKNKQTCAPHAEIWVMMHFPPIYDASQSSDFAKLMHEFEVTRCIYGHLHGPGIAGAVTGEVEGVQYELVSCDAIHFTPKPIAVD